VHDADLEPLFATFLPLNEDLLRLATSWQAADERKRWSLATELGALDDRTGVLLRSIAAVAPRFDGYRARLRAARRKVEDGDGDWLTSPRIDSYHTVWMELHEDLLLALGRSRAD